MSAKARILIIEDEAIIAMNVQSLLELRGYTVTGIAATAEDGRRQAAADVPDIVLMDMTLGGEQCGIETATELHRTLDLPVVFLTGHTDEGMIARARESAGASFMFKPIREYELAPVIETALARHALERENRRYRSGLEQRVAEQDDALARSDALYRTVVSLSPDLITIADAQGAFTFVSPTCMTMFGVASVDEVLGTTPLDWMDPADHERAIVNMAAIMQGDYRPNHEYRMRRRDGSLFFVEANSAVLRGDAGEPCGFLTILRDITERKFIKEALVESEERFRSLADAAFEGLAISYNGVLVDVNTQLAALLGYGPVEMVGRPIADFVDPGSRGQVEQSITAGSEAPYTNTLRRKDGCPLVVETQARMATFGGRLCRVTAVRALVAR